jgi:hypothetical protein
MQWLIASTGVSLVALLSATEATSLPHATPDGFVLLDTGAAFGDPMGTLGFDLCPEQSAAARFRPTRDVTVNRLETWLMSHRPDGALDAPVVASVRYDIDGRPGDSVLASLELPAMRGGWRPERIVGDFDPIVLLGGRDYWLVLECGASLGTGAIWCFAGTFAVSANTYGSAVNWQVGARGPVGAAVLLGSGECYVDGAGPRGLDIRDFVNFQARFLAGDGYACDCDLTTGESRCDIFDFLCFQDRFVRGCR